MPEHRMGGGKPKSMKASFVVYLKSIKHYRWPILIAILLTIGSAVLMLFIPKILGDMTTIAVNSFPDLDWSALGGKALLVIVLFISSAALNYGQAYILAVVTARYTKGLREQILEKISRMPIAYFDKHQFGDTLSRMSNDIDVLMTSMSQEIADVSLSVTTLIGTMIVMLTISVPLSLISFIVVPLSVIVVGQVMRFAQKYFREQQATLGVLNSKIEEDYSGEIVIKSNSYEDDAFDSFSETNERLATVTRKAQVFSAL